MSDIKKKKKKMLDRLNIQSGGDFRPEEVRGGEG